MSSRRTNRSKHPYVVEKMLGQPSPFTKNVFRCSGCTYLNGGQRNPLLSPVCQRASPSAGIPPPTIFVGAPTEKRTNPPLHPLYHFIAKLVRVTAFAPIERVRLLIQNQGVMIKSGRLLEPYKGNMNCITRIIKNEGIISLWRGNGVDVIRHICDGVLSSVFHSHFRRIQQYYLLKKDGFWKWFAGTSLATGLTNATCLLGTYPLLYAQTRLANDIKTSRESKRQFNGLIDVWKRTLRSDGITGIYRGYNVAVLERILQTWAFIAIHKVTKLPKYLTLLGVQNDWLVKYFAIYGVYFAASLATYPMDTICRRMMMTCGETVKYKTSLDAYSQILKKEGLVSLYRGVEAHILRATIRFGLAIFYYHALKRLAGAAKNNGSGGGDQSSSAIINIKWRSGRE